MKYTKGKVQNIASHGDLITSENLPIWTSSFLRELCSLVSFFLDIKVCGLNKLCGEIVYDMECLNGK